MGLSDMSKSHFKINLGCTLVWNGLLVLGAIYQIWNGEEPNKGSFIAFSIPVTLAIWAFGAEQDDREKDRLLQERNQIRPEDIY